MKRIALSLCLALTPMVAGAQTFPPPQRVTVLDETLPPAAAPHLVKGVRITFAPGQPGPLHRHPVPTVGVVTRGAFLFQAEGQAPVTLRQGDSFHEAAGQRIIHFDNASAAEPAEFVVFYLLERPDQPPVEMLPPAP